MSVESINTANLSNTSVAAQQQKETQATLGQVNQQQAQAEKIAANVPADDAKLSVEEAEKVANTMNDFMSKAQHNLNFSVDKDTDNVVVKVIDKQTDEVIRQFPSEEAIKLSKHIEGMLGLIFSDKA